MSFFNKLKSKLFKSSSQLDQGLDAIVEDGGAVSEADPAPEPQADPAPTTPEPQPPQNLFPPRRPRAGGRGARSHPRRARAIRCDRTLLQATGRGRAPPA